MSKLEAIISLYNDRGEVVQRESLTNIGLAAIISKIHLYSVQRRMGDNTFVRLTADIAYPVNTGAQHGKT